VLVRVGPLPDNALAAAAMFYAEWVDPPRAGADVLIVFPPADHSHRAWRLAAVQGLARQHAPLRVNAVASDDDAAIAGAAAYLAAAPGVTGQYLPLDGTGAGAVIGSGR
jgi:hypothetical protein